MARLVTEATAEFGDGIRFKKVITKKMEGARRYQEIIKQTKALVPIPSILINGRLAFTTIPGKQELIDFLNRLVHK